MDIILQICYGLWGAGSSQADNVTQRMAGSQSHGFWERTKGHFGYGTVASDGACQELSGD
eukprot:scaffold39441_cov16-Prasinocladus_malaysianus.AAC.1